jgi:hypothetical protein
MNRVELASDRSGMHLRQIGLNIRAGKAAAQSQDEYGQLVDALEVPATTGNARRNLLMLALMDGGTHDGLLRYCKTLLERTAKVPGFTGYESASNMALQYLLAKPAEDDYWVRQFEHSKCAVLRQAVAAHVFNTDSQRALVMMIETIPLVGTDHAVRDTIDLWLSNEASPPLLAAVDMKLANLTRTEPASQLTAAYRLARSVIANA